MKPINFRNPAHWNSVPVPARVAERAFNKVDKRDDGCWISLYSVASHGYSQVGWQNGADRHVVLGHRAAWSHVNGQVPLGMTLDHLCNTRRCVNPEHLRLLPNFENARRIKGMDWPMGSCANGHSSSNLREVFGKTNKSGQPRRSFGCAKCYAIYDKRFNWRIRKPGQPFPDDLLLQSEREQEPA